MGASGNVGAQRAARGGAWSIAGLAAGVVGGALDTVVAGTCEFHRRGCAPVPRSVALEIGAVCAGTVGALALVAALFDIATRRASVNQRGILAVAFGTACGIWLARALLWGGAIRRSGLRPVLIVATVLAFVVGSAALFGARERVARSMRTVPSAWSAAFASTSLGAYAGHVFVLRRLYPWAHAFAAAIACMCAIAAVRVLQPRMSRAATMLVRATFVALLVGAGVASARVMRSEVTRAFAMEHAPIAAFSVRGLARVTPARTVASVALRDDRSVSGQSFDFRGLDVVLVTVDALRADRLQAYGGPPGRAPTIDALAREGITFDRAYCTTPHTSYSLASLFTGKYFEPLSRMGGRTHTTLTQRLRDVGYATAAFFPPAVFHVDGDRLGDLRARAFDFERSRISWDPAATRAVDVERWLVEIPAARRVFVWVHLFEPHEPYDAHDATRGQFGDGALGRYDEEIRTADGAITQIRDAFARRARRAVWIVTADHGEEFGEHGGRFHGTTLFDEQARVPLIVSAPGLRSTRVREPASLVDVFPTLLAALRLPRPSRLRGRDLGPVVFGDARGVSVFASVGTQQMIVRSGQKLICDVATDTCELYDLVHDAGERRNVIDGNSPSLRDLREQLAAWGGSHGVFELERGGEDFPAVLVRAMQGDRSVVLQVAALLAGPDTRVAARAARVLGDLRARVPEVLVALALAANGARIAVRTEAALSLALLEDPRGGDMARTILAGGSPNDRRRAALGLARLGDRDGVDVLIAAVRDPAADASSVDAWVDALDGLHAPAATELWIALLDDPRLGPRAARALAGNRDPRVRPALARAIATTPYELTRDAARAAMR